MKFFLILFIFVCNAYSYIYDISNELVDINNMKSFNAKDMNQCLKLKNYKDINHIYRYLRHASKQNRCFNFTLKNNTNFNLKRTLVSKWKNADLELFILEDNKTLIHKTLDDSSSTGYIKYDFTFKKDSIYNIILFQNIQTYNDEFYYFHVIDSKDYMKNITKYQSLYDSGFFIGILFVIIIYTFSSFLINKEDYNLYFSLFILCIVLLNSNFRFFIYDVIPSYSFFILKIFLPIAVYVLFILFIKSFLNLKEYFPKINFVANLLLIYYGFVFIYRYLYTDSPYFINFINIVFVVFIYAAYKKFKMGDGSAFYFMLGIISFVLFIIIFIVSNLTNNTILFNTSIQLSSSINAIFFMISIQHRIRNLYLEREKINTQRLKDKEIMYMQSKLASMGEMIGNIAHQWRQPINSVSSILSNIKVQYHYNKLTEKTLDSKMNEANIQLKYMSNTIEDFLNFFSNKNKKSEYLLTDICQQALVLTRGSLKIHKIHVIEEYNDSSTVFLDSSSLIQVLIILINNSRDAFNSNKIKNPTITIAIKEHTIIFTDNAGGISSEIINKIFDPYFSTKDKKIGTGLGLYMAKQIIENTLNASIKVSTKNNSTIFTLDFTKY